MRDRSKGGFSIRRMRIQTKITLCIFLVVAIPITIVMAIFNKPLYNMMVASTISEEQNASSLIAPEIEKQVDIIIENMRTVTSQKFYEKMFYAELSDSPEKMAEIDEAYDFAECIKDIEDTTPINAVKVYVGIDDNDIYKSSSVGDIFRPESDIVSTYWHGIFSGGNYADLFCPSFYLSNKEKTELGNCAYIVRTSMYYDGVVYPAYLALYYDNSVYGDILKNNTSTDGSVSYIINDRDAVVVATDMGLAGTYRLKYNAIRDELMASNSFVEREVADVSVLVAFHSISNTGWFLVNVIPKEQVTSIAEGWMIQFVTITIVCSIIVLIIAIWFARSITGRIGAVSMQMAKVHDGPPVAMEESYYKDEVGELIESYNYMTGEMNNLIRKQEETAQELRFAEFNALQAQINPHFLYNTMDMINWMALQGRNKEVSEVVQNLSKFYKLTLSRKKDYSTIADELEHASVYIDLQNMRFNDAIDFVIDVPDELTECRLPKLTFQPILENAILHGILEKEEKYGTIVITVWSEEDDIKILISDDGVGMSDDIIANILSEERIKPTNSRGANVAIVNIHRRLQLLYGDKYGLSYVSSPGKGCDVTISLPKHVGSEPYVKN